MAEGKSEQELEEYLARIRRTISESQALVAQAELRMAETDRMLKSQGLTREQVMAMHFSDEQVKMVNAELARHGLDPVPEEIATGRQAIVESYAPPAIDSSPDEEMANRRSKFGMMMKPFQI